MGGFAALLGHAAGGFEQARQQDLSRQFADEQNRRAAAGEFLHGIITDPNQSDELRQAATQAYMEHLVPSKGGAGKPIDFGKMLGPLAEVGARIRAKQQAAANVPAPPIHEQVAAVQGQAAPASIGALPPPPPGMIMGGIASGAAPAAQAMQQSAPPQQAASAPAPVVQAAPSSMPPPPPDEQTGMYASSADIARKEGYKAQQVAQGTETGQLNAMGEAADRILQQHPEYAQDPMIGPALAMARLNKTLPFAAMLKPTALGQSVPGSDLLNDPNPEVAQAARDQGVRPDKYYNSRQLGTGSWKFAQTAGKGETAATGGGLQSQTQQQQQTAAVHYGVWQKQNATQFGQRQALLNQEFQLGVNRGYIADANKAFVDSVKDYGSSMKTMQSMDEAYKSIQANPNNQQAQVALLMSHIGMTLGVVKGARVGKAQIEEAEQSRTAMAGLASRLNFDKNGDLNWSDPIRKGVTLTPDQMQQMVDLGHQRMNILHQNIGVMHDALSPDQMGVQPIGTSFNTPASAPTTKAGSASKKKLTAPPAPPSSGKKQAYQQDGKWYDAATHQEIH